MFKRFCLLLAIQAILLVSCGEDKPDPVAPDTGTSKKYFAAEELIDCTDANAQRYCVGLGYTDMLDYSCATRDGKQVLGYITCWKP